jgi:hypothetical protein
VLIWGEKTEVRKSRDTVPLSLLSLFENKTFRKWYFSEMEKLKTKLDETGQVITIFFKLFNDLIY